MLSFFEGDIRDVNLLRKICRGASLVFHLASIIDIHDSVEYSEIYGVNVKGKVLAVPLQYDIIQIQYSRKESPQC